MGLLTDGVPLDWETTKKHKGYVKKHGIQQFINIYRKLQERQNDDFKWGDEVKSPEWPFEDLELYFRQTECFLVHFDDEQKKARLALCAAELLPKLQKAEEEAKVAGDTSKLTSLWRLESGSFMVENCPGNAYLSVFEGVKDLEVNMMMRRKEANRALPDGVSVVTCSTFPRLGCPDFTFPSVNPDPNHIDSILHSLFVPDAAVFMGHPRIPTMAKNACARRGSKPPVNVPIWMDKHTPENLTEDLCALGDTGYDQSHARAGHVYLDTSWLGCCCLQVTFQARNTDEGRHLYDQLVPLCPIMLALTASSPFLRGYLVDNDVRWNVASQCLDDRTDGERGLEPLKDSEFLISKSRYDAVDWYLSEAGQQYNDVDLLYDKEAAKVMMDAGVDQTLAKHVAHLFIRDPLLILSDRLHLDDEKDTDHFEGLQSTNWQTLRFKPPPPECDIGCRVEFRPMEIQVTDFENAAFVIFMVLVSRVVLTYDLNLLIPMSKVAQNMEESYKTDAARTNKFFFRKDILPEANSVPFYKKYLSYLTKEYAEMTVNEIINGKPEEFPGLLPLVKDYLKSTEMDVDTRNKLRVYLRFIKRKASGDLKTTARWARDFVRNHPSYKFDSVVSDEINYDLMRTCRALASGEAFDVSLLLERVHLPEDSDPEDLWSEVHDKANCKSIQGTKSECESVACNPYEKEFQLL